MCVCIHACMQNYLCIHTDTERERDTDTDTHTDTQTHRHTNTSLYFYLSVTEAVFELAFKPFAVLSLWYLWGKGLGSGFRLGVRV